ncbi:GNAT family N-acetyltransferase [Nocardioides sp.]|uniref:GNAT family N-acetyltransferase n=1 Tax=Nocardioides sp. TaxID=35761 RepID=UPI002724CF9D|nr:GNAT family N-acetyltransferase [Nocardioides sp.]MDO9456303.1 GNAT family N-acetyltransferase [Nocardioides sp.]
MPGTSSLRLERVAYGDPDALRLVEDVQAEYVVRYGSPDATPLDPLMFEPPAGSFYVGYLDAGDGDTPVATGAWRRSDVVAFGSTRTAEVKRMYVVPAARGRGLARVVLAHLEATAAAAGAEVLLLETGTKQPEAIALYESSGYVTVPGFGYYKDAPLSRCFGKDLRVGGAA